MGDDRTRIQMEELALILETCETRKQVQALSLGSVGITSRGWESGTGKEGSR